MRPQGPGFIRSEGLRGYFLFCPHSREGNGSALSVRKMNVAAVYKINGNKERQKRLELGGGLADGDCRPGGMLLSFVVARRGGAREPDGGVCHRHLIRL